MTSPLDFQTEGPGFESEQGNVFFCVFFFFFHYFFFVWPIVLKLLKFS